MCVFVGRIMEHGEVHDRRGAIRRQSNRRLRQATTEHLLPGELLIFGMHTDKCILTNT